MTRAVARLAAAAWNPAEADDVVRLDWEFRHRRRHRVSTASGHEVLVDLPRAEPLRAGDGLLLDDGRRLRVEAADEPLIRIVAETPFDLLRCAYHLGNRHLEVALAEDVLLIRPDPVIERMVQGLGATTASVTGPFQPEGGAYQESGHGHHGHGHGHGHDHDH